VTAARAPSGGPHDVETRRRVLDAATELFAEHGFRRVTVRAICERARANVASVNYHFGDKQRLYREVVEAALDTVRDFADHAMRPPDGATPERKLAHYIDAHLARAQSSRVPERSSLLRELFRHELSEASEIGAYIVDQAIKPRLRYLAAVVGELLGASAESESVERCVLSIQAQCLFPVAAPVALTPMFRRTRADYEALARHVFEFSLAGIRACRVEARAGLKEARGGVVKSVDRKSSKSASGAGRRSRTSSSNRRPRAP
jgi:AcrR family transcriptional regulator